MQPVARSIVGALAAALALATAVSGPRAALADPPSPSAGAWEFLRPQFYGDRDIGVVDESFMRIEAPSSTPDPAATPITVHFGAAAVGHIERLRLIIDNNPSPLAATVEFAPGARIADLGLRVRVDRFTSIRAVAETREGRVEMRSQWVNASGGCSAPPTAGEGGTLGAMRFRASADDRILQVSIRHPNHSGFQIDPKTGDPIPPHFIAKLRITSGGEPLLTAETGISLSENPTLRLTSDRPFAAPVDVQAEDSKEARFSGEWRGASVARVDAAP